MKGSFYKPGMIYEGDSVEEDSVREFCARAELQPEGVVAERGGF